MERFIQYSKAVIEIKKKRNNKLSDGWIFTSQKIDFFKSFVVCLSNSEKLIKKIFEEKKTIFLIFTDNSSSSKFYDA